jgi:hypothetical protein
MVLLYTSIPTSAVTVKNIRKENKNSDSVDKGKFIGILNCAPRHDLSFRSVGKAVRVFHVGSKVDFVVKTDCNQN